MHLYIFIKIMLGVKLRFIIWEFSPRKAWCKKKNYKLYNRNYLKIDLFIHITWICQAN